ncbi:MAG TPA: hypothetical protein VIK19_00345 [Syntrophales bacterium]
MNYRPRLQLSPPVNWADFETLCLGLWKVIWDNHNTQKNGRQGQPQKGVDIHGQLKNTRNWAGVQCKGKENFTNKILTKKEISKEAKKAKGFNPRLVEYTIATTAPKSAKIQEYARKLTDRFLKKGWFSITICGWDDIEDLLYNYEPPIASQIYPLVFGVPPDLMENVFGHFSENCEILGAEKQKIKYIPENGYKGLCSITAEYSLGQKTKKIIIDVEINDDNLGGAKINSKILELLFSINDKYLRQPATQGVVSSDASLASSVDKATGRV